MRRHRAPDFVSEPDATHLATHDQLVQVFVALTIYEELQHVVTQVIELVFVNATVQGIIPQQPEEERPLVLIISLLRPEGKRQIGAAIELLVHASVTFTTQRDAVACLECPLRV